MSHFIITLFLTYITYFHIFLTVNNKSLQSNTKYIIVAFDYKQLKHIFKRRIAKASILKVSLGSQLYLYEREFVGL